MSWTKRILTLTQADKKYARTYIVARSSKMAEQATIAALKWEIEGSCWSQVLTPMLMWVRFSQLWEKVNHNVVATWTGTILLSIPLVSPMNIDSDYWSFELTRDIILQAKSHHGIF